MAAFVVCGHVKETALSTPPDDSRSSLARGMMWATQISTLCLELSLPMFAGYWLDQRWGTQPWLLLLGMGLGICIFSLGVIRLSRDISKKS